MLGRYRRLFALHPKWPHCCPARPGGLGFGSFLSCCQLSRCSSRHTAPAARNPGTTTLSGVTPTFHSEPVVLSRAVLSLPEGTLDSVSRHFMEKEMATHSSLLAWRIPWTEEPGRLHRGKLSPTGRKESDTTEQLSTRDIFDCYDVAGRGTPSRACEGVSNTQK